MEPVYEFVLGPGGVALILVAGVINICIATRANRALADREKLAARLNYLKSKIELLMEKGSGLLANVALTLPAGGSREEVNKHLSDWAKDIEEAHASAETTYAVIRHCFQRDVVATLDAGLEACRECTRNLESVYGVAVLESNGRKLSDEERTRYNRAFSDGLRAMSTFREELRMAIRNELALTAARLEDRADVNGCNAAGCTYDDSYPSSRAATPGDVTGNEEDNKPWGVCNSLLWLVRALPLAAILGSVWLYAGAASGEPSGYVAATAAVAGSIAFLNQACDNWFWRVVLPARVYHRKFGSGDGC